MAVWVTRFEHRQNNTSIYVYMYDWLCENSANEKAIFLYQVSYRLGFYNFKRLKKITLSNAKKLKSTKERSERLEEKKTDTSLNCYAIYANFEEKKCLTQDEIFINTFIFYCKQETK